MKRVLIFSTSYFPLVGGAEVAVKEITDRIQGIEFDLITAQQNRNYKKVEKIGNITVYRIGFGLGMLDKLLVPFLGAAKTWKLNKEKHYSAFWCIMASYASGAAYIANWFQKKVPIILTLQEGDSEARMRFRWFGLIDLSWRLALARTKVLTVISTYLGNRAKKLGYKGQIELIPNGVDLHKFKFVSHTLNPDKITLITTSRLNVKNAIGDVIEALKFLPDNVHFQILGIGELEHQLKAQVKNLHLENRVQFAGLVDQNDIPNYLDKADIFIRPSLSEGMGNSFIEAMAAGIPVIATPVGGIPDFLKDGSTGLFCEVHNPKSITGAVMRLTSDQELRENIIQNAHKLVSEKYGWNLIAESIRSKVFNII